MLHKFAAGAVMLALAGGIAMAQAPAPQKRMSLSSSSFTDGGIIPDKHSQVSAAPVSPALSWGDVPAGTVSFALVVDDPDTALAKSPNEVLHWLAFNIPGTVTSLPEGVPNTPTLPDGTVQPLNTGKKNGFMGSGAGCCVYHHYTFQIFALDTKLDLGPDATREQVMKAMDGHILGKAVTVGRFHRPA